MKHAIGVSRIGVILMVMWGPLLLTAEMEILQTEVQQDGTLKVVFTDQNPPMPYAVEQYRADMPESPWQSLAWSALHCTQSATFEASVPRVFSDTGLFRISASRGYDLPLVIATNPANGATGISPDLEMVSISFDRPMDGTAAIKADGNWGASYVTWSDDLRTAEIHRLSYPTPLPGSMTISLKLNPEGEGFVDESGISLAPIDIRFKTGAASVSGPYVVSSIPENGATDVDPFLETVILEFNEPMLPVGGFTSSGWWPWTLTWSDDGKTAYVSRGEPGNPLFNQAVLLKPISFYNIQSTAMTAEFSLHFTTASAPRERIEANPGKGFSWPYYLVIPPEITSPGTLLVEPNNTGSWNDDPWIHEQAALTLLDHRSSFAIELGCPLLVPVFPRPKNPAAPEPGGIYVHALDRYSLSEQWSGIEQIDFQLEAMIDDALQRLRTLGHSMDDRVFMMGFSASGAFTSRFSILHPQRIKAAGIGSPGGWPCAPIASWQGTPLPYPVGVQNLFGEQNREFNLQAFRQVALYIYVGGSDTNDALDFRGMTQEETSLIHQMLNYPADPILANRWPLAESMFNSVNANATFVVYPGITHTITTEMFDDLRAFFSANR